jgi:hypothetical protein
MAQADGATRPGSDIAQNDPAGVMPRSIEAVGLAGSVSRTFDSARDQRLTDAHTCRPQAGLNVERMLTGCASAASRSRACFASTSPT